MIQTWVAVFNAPKQFHSNITWDMQKHCELYVSLCALRLCFTMFFNVLCTGAGFSAAVIYIYGIPPPNWWVDM